MGILPDAALRPDHRDMVVVESDPVSMIDRLESWRPVKLDKWADRSQR